MKVLFKPMLILDFDELAHIKFFFVQNMKILIPMIWNLRLRA